MTSSLAVAFTAYICPGAFTFLGFSIQLAKLPESVKPALSVISVCEARPTIELYETVEFNKARGRVAQLGKPAQLYELRDGAVVGPSLVDWLTEPKFKETYP